MNDGREKKCHVLTADYNFHRNFISFERRESCFYYSCVQSRKKTYLLDEYYEIKYFIDKYRAIKGRKLSDLNRRIVTMKNVNMYFEYLFYIFFSDCYLNNIFLSGYPNSYFILSTK